MRCFCELIVSVLVIDIQTVPRLILFYVGGVTLLKKIKSLKTKSSKYCFYAVYSYFRNVQLLIMNWLYIDSYKPVDYSYLLESQRKQQYKRKSGFVSKIIKNTIYSKANLSLFHTTSFFHYYTISLFLIIGLYKFRLMILDR